MIVFNYKVLLTINYIFLQAFLHYMSSKQILILIILLPFFVNGQFNDKKTYEIKKIEDAPIIDGNMNDKIWTELNIARDFTQISPNNGFSERPNQKTEVKICFDNKNIYFGVMMYDNYPDSILRELAVRDNNNANADQFAIYIDPFSNGQIEYELMVSAAGVQSDAKITTSSVDKSWDAVWNSSVKIYDNGWFLEVSIPFSQLRFPENIDYWSINMARGIRRYREDYSWNPINVEFSDFSLQAGILNGIKNINSPIRLSLMPYISIYADNFDGETTFPYNYGADLKYGINESFTLDMSLIPDFGQVASDAMVLNLSPFEMKYDEKRQFFNEGTELFSKGDDMFYSRRLKDDLLNATKITGRTSNGLGISVLNAITNKTDDNPLTNYNVMIYDKSFRNNSSVSLMNTNMLQNGSDKDANVTGLFTRINNKSNTRVFVAKLKMSQEIENSTNSKGFAGMIAVGKTSGNYQYNLYSKFEDDKYNSNDLGFLYANNEITNGLVLTYNQFNKTKRFIDFATSLELENQTLFTEQKFVDFHFELETKATLKNYTTIFVKTSLNPYEKNDFYEARTNDLAHPLKRSKKFDFGSWISTDYRNTFAIDLSGGFNIRPLYDGYTNRFRISPRYRASDKLSFNYILSVKNSYNDIGFVTNDTLYFDPFGLFLTSPEIDYIFSKRNTRMITNVIKGNYIINNKINLSIKIRYHIDQVKNLEFMSLSKEGYLCESQYYDNNNINYTTWTSDLIFNWRFAPGSELSIVWKNAIDDQKSYLINYWSENFEDTFTLAQKNSISLKLIYYLDYLYLQK